MKRISSGATSLGAPWGACFPASASRCKARRRISHASSRISWPCSFSNMHQRRHLRRFSAGHDAFSRGAISVAWRMPFTRPPGQARPLSAPSWKSPEASSTPPASQKSASRARWTTSSVTDSLIFEFVCQYHRHCPHAHEHGQPPDGDGLSVRGAPCSTAGHRRDCLFPGRLCHLSVMASVTSFFANHNCVYFPAGSNAVGVCITGNTMTAFAPGTTGGITLDGANSYFIITGNVFNNLGLAVKLGSGSSFCNVQSNVYYGCTGNTQDTGTSNVIGGGSA